MAVLALSDPRVRSLARAIPEGACLACVGRSFARLESGLENAERGRAIVGQEAVGPVDSCVICEGMVGRIDLYASLVEKALSDYDFETFLVGSKFFDEVVDVERRVWQALLESDDGQLASQAEQPPGGAPPWPFGEWLKNEVNRQVGKRIEAATGKKVDFGRPDIVVQLDTRADVVSVDSRSILIKGRYRKLDRTTPQTRWPCRYCGGIGCRDCGFGGKRYQTSVEEEVGRPAMAVFEGRDHSFHGMGREDVDARMLGTGRPFVLEVKQPRRRAADLGALAREINQAAVGRVEVEGLSMAAPGDPARYKEADPAKAYQAFCVAEAPVDGANLLKEVLALAGVALKQRTPARVAHRRGDRVRSRRIRSLSVLEHAGDRFMLEIHADAGTYIKEFVSGDDGRTTPSLAASLGVACRVEALDVVEIDWKE